MQGRLGQTTPEDAALQQRLQAAQMQAGRGPQMQGLGRPGWQTASPTEAISRANVMEGGPRIQNLGQAMGSIPTDQAGSVANPAAAKAGYYASQPGAMGQFWRQNATPVEQPRWMARG